MNPRARRWMFGALLVASMLEIGLNHALPAALHTLGGEVSVPIWLSVCLANSVALLGTAILADLGRHLFGRHRITGTLMILLSASALAWSVVPIASSDWLLGIGLACVMAASMGLAASVQTPFRVLLAITMMGSAEALALLRPVGERFLDANANQWMAAGFEVWLLVLSIALFGAWCTPIKSTWRGALWVGLIASLVVAALPAAGGHVGAAAMASVTGMSFFLPVPFYTVGAFFWTSTVANLLLGPVHRMRGAALLLLAATHCSASTSSCVLLAVIGLAFLSLSYPPRTNPLLAEWRKVLARQTDNQAGPAAVPV